MQTLTPSAAIRAFAAQYGLAPRAKGQRKPGGSYAAWAHGLGYGTANHAMQAGAVVASMPACITDPYGLPVPSAALYVVRGVGGCLYLCSGYTPSHGLGLWDFVPANKG